MAKPVMCMMQMGVLVSLGVTDLGFLGVPNVRSVNVTECVPRASEPECARMECDGERENVGSASTQTRVVGRWKDGRHEPHPPSTGHRVDPEYSPQRWSRVDRHIEFEPWEAVWCSSHRMTARAT